jgi:hypothetical protein
LPETRNWYASTCPWIRKSVRADNHLRRPRIHPPPRRQLRNVQHLSHFPPPLRPRPGQSLADTIQTPDTPPPFVKQGGHPSKIDSSRTFPSLSPPVQVNK